MEMQRQLKSDIHIFPNPAGDQFTVDAGGQLITKVELLNIAGQLIDTRVANSQKVFFERNKIMPGVYFCKAYTNSGCSISKIIFKD
jgi:hypothetical protein